MGDPLSMTAGALTVIGAAVETCKAFAHYKQFKTLPHNFSSLFAEVADLDHVLKECLVLEKSRALQIGGLDDNALDIQRHAQRASDKLVELAAQIIKQTAPIGFSSPPEIKAFWCGLVHGKSRLSRARDELRDIRLALSSVLQLVTSSLLSSIGSAVGDIQESQQLISAHQQELTDFVKTVTERAQAASRQPALPSYEDSEQEAVTSCTRFSSAPSVKSRAMTREKPGMGPRRRTMATSTIPVVEDPLRSTCVAWCSCQCHMPSSVRSYKPLKDLFGSLSITHSGLPYLTRACDQKKCRRRATPKVNMSYKLPGYWMDRLFTMSMSSGDLAGPEARVRLPRVVNWESPVWQCATSGNVKRIEGLFRDGLASPWDVQLLSGNLLHYVTDHWNADLCRLLLDAGVDPNAEDDFKNTPVGIAWERVLSGRMSPNDSSVIASLFSGSDYLTQRAFTPIHKIVLGLVSKNLEAELECSTKDIDVPDSRGRTPLAWAAARGDEAAVQVLLDFEADVHIADICGDSPLHLVRNTACASLLIAAGASVSALNEEGMIPLHRACQYVRSASLVDTLVQAGSAIDAPDALQHQTPLHVATSKPPALPFMDILLDAGADINAHNKSADSPLRFALTFNMHGLVRRMLEPAFGADFSGMNAPGSSFSHALARSADVETLRILTAARPASLVPDLVSRNVTGKTSTDYLEERLALMDKDEADELRPAFQALVDALDARDAARHGVVEEVVAELVKGLPDVPAEVSVVEEVVASEGVVEIVKGLSDVPVAVSVLEEEDDIFHETVEVL